MGEAKRRKPVPAPTIDQFAHRWTPETGAKLAALCGCDVRLSEICTLGFLIAAGAVSASDHANLSLLLDSARPRVRTAREHWPRLIEAAVLASQDSVFVRAGEPLSATLAAERKNALPTEIGRNLASHVGAT
jgi:hypothetical protein